MGLLPFVDYAELTSSELVYALYDLAVPGPLPKVGLKDVESGRTEPSVVAAAEIVRAIRPIVPYLQTVPHLQDEGLESGGKHRSTDLVDKILELPPEIRAEAAGELAPAFRDVATKGAHAHARLSCLLDTQLDLIYSEKYRNTKIESIVADTLTWAWEKHCLNINQSVRFGHLKETIRGVLTSSDHRIQEYISEHKTQEPKVFQDTAANLIKGGVLESWNLEERIRRFASAAEILGDKLRLEAADRQALSEAARTRSPRPRFLPWQELPPADPAQIPSARDPSPARLETPEPATPRSSLGHGDRDDPQVDTLTLNIRQLVLTPGQPAQTRGISSLPPLRPGTSPRVSASTRSRSVDRDDTGFGL